MVLDEATASVDAETEALVEQTVMEAFSDCTLLIIAHRLHSILSCDRVIVLSQGKVSNLLFLFSFLLTVTSELRLGSVSSRYHL